MSFMIEIVNKLVADGVGIYSPPGQAPLPGTNIFSTSKAIIPTGAGPYLSLIETGGTGSDITQNGSPIERPSMQFMSRATSPTAGRAMLVAAYISMGGADGL